MDLNVGVGTVNIITNPLYFPSCFHIDVKKMVHVNLVADVQHLPFQDKAFENAFCFHVLEHLDNPGLALKELCRVTKECVEIEVPHRFSQGARDKVGGHKCSFRANWFNQSLKNVCYCMQARYEFPRKLRLHVWIYPHVQKVHS